MAINNADQQIDNPLLDKETLTLLNSYGAILCCLREETCNRFITILNQLKAGHHLIINDSNIIPFEEKLCILRKIKRHAPIYPLALLEAARTKRNLTIFHAIDSLCQKIGGAVISTIITPDISHSAYAMGENEWPNTNGYQRLIQDLQGQGVHIIYKTKEKSPADIIKEAVLHHAQAVSR